MYTPPTAPIVDQIMSAIAETVVLAGRDADVSDSIMDQAPARRATVAGIILELDARLRRIGMPSLYRSFPADDHPLTSYSDALRDSA